MPKRTKSVSQQLPAKWHTEKKNARTTHESDTKHRPMALGLITQKQLEYLQ